MNNQDCNDFEDSIHPGATEIPGDGIDQDCDGSDLSSLATYYQDSDNDGYGDPGSPYETTSQPWGYVTNSSDCNDYDSSIHPGVTESHNGIDDNCNGVVDEEHINTLQGFDENFYLNAKLIQLKVSDPATWSGYTTAKLGALLANYGFTAESHYQQYGYSEGLSPNAYFNEEEYKLAKATALFNAGVYRTVDGAQAAFNAAWSDDTYLHYIQYGAAEGLNPSNSFDETKYLADKLSALQSNGVWVGKTVDDLRTYFASIGMSALEHYFTYGRSEGLVGKATSK
jgi:hypothetical protein